LLYPQSQTVPSFFNHHAMIESARDGNYTGKTRDLNRRGLSRRVSIPDLTITIVAHVQTVAGRPSARCRGILLLQLRQHREGSKPELGYLCSSCFIPKLAVCVITQAQTTPTEQILCVLGLTETVGHVSARVSPPEIISITTAIRIHRIMA